MKIDNRRQVSRAITAGQWAVFLFGAPVILAPSLLWNWRIMDHLYGHILTILVIGAATGIMGALKRRIDPEVMLNERRLLVRAAISLAQVSLVHFAAIVLFFTWWIFDLKEGDWKGDLLKIIGVACACIASILILEWGKLRLTQWRDNSSLER